MVYFKITFFGPTFLSVRLIRVQRGRKCKWCFVDVRLFYSGNFPSKFTFPVLFFLSRNFNTFVFRFNSGTCSSELIVFCVFHPNFSKFKSSRVVFPGDGSRPRKMQTWRRHLLPAPLTVLVQALPVPRPLLRSTENRTRDRKLSRTN